MPEDFGGRRVRPVLYACESGSRALGFASRDSDWDVRFIYLHRPDYYLAIDVERRRDVIEQLDGDLNLAGWDLRKALWLLHKSNPSLLEWLNSPIVYADRFGLAARLREMADVFTTRPPPACIITGTWPRVIFVNICGERLSVSRSTSTSCGRC